MEQVERLDKYNEFDKYDELLKNRINEKWGVSRLYRWLSKECPYIGDIVIVNHILNVAKENGTIINPKNVYSLAKNEGFEFQIDLISVA